MPKRKPHRVSLRGGALTWHQQVCHGGVVDTKHIIALSSTLVNKGGDSACAVSTPVIGAPCTTQMDGKQQAVTNMQNPGPQHSPTQLASCQRS